jgi:hypothetical protein
LDGKNVAGGMMTQAEEGMKLFEAQQGTAAEVDKVGPAEFREEKPRKT